MPILVQAPFGLPPLSIVGFPFYPLAVAALALSAVLDIAKAIAHHAGRELAALLIQIPLIAAVGLAFGTPLDTLPPVVAAREPVGADWSGVALFLHGVAALALPTLLWTWLTSVSASSGNALLGLLKQLRGPAPHAAEDKFTQFGGLRLAYALFYLVATCAVGELLVSQPIGAYYMNLLGLYFVLICLDNMVAGLVGPSHFGLRLGAAVVLLLITIAGTTSLLRPITSANPGLSYIVWLKAGLAATVYALFAALVGRVQERLKYATAWWHLDLIWRNIKARWRREPAPGDVAHQVMAGFSKVTAALFFGGLLLYDLLFDHVSRLPGVIPLLGLTFAAIVSGGVALLSRRLIDRTSALRNDPVLKDAVFDSVHAMLGFVPALLLVLSAASGLLGLSPAGASGDTSDATLDWIPQPPNVAVVGSLTDGQFWYVTAAHVISILLVLLTLGQLRFLLTLLWARYGHRINKLIVSIVKVS